MTRSYFQITDQYHLCLSFQRYWKNARLISFIESNNVICSGQYGFREKRSTSMALIELLENITYNCDKKMVTAGVFIDLKKAFDTVNHDILLKKLHHYGIRGIARKWIGDYLSHREQYVKYNNAESARKTIKCGVLQGSILAPILFLLYINDLSNISKKLKFILFADDTNVLYSDTTVEKVVGIINSELKYLSLLLLLLYFVSSLYQQTILRLLSY